jgi:hypothetical protein
MAREAAALAARIRATFLEWPREAQALVIQLALQLGVLGRVHRHAFGLWLRWHSGDETREELLTKFAAFTPMVTG